METTINWEYFFGGSSNGGKIYDRYYKSEINGKRVEKHASSKGIRYAVGNIDEAEVKFKTESELIKAASK